MLGCRAVDVFTIHADRRAVRRETPPLSIEPERETIFLVAHGSGDERQNEHWRRVLDSLASRMRGNRGEKFRAIHTATWRED